MTNEMTPHQEAIEVYEMFYFTPDENGFYSQNKYRAKKQALICVQKIINVLSENKYLTQCAIDLNHYESVKIEIEALN